MALRPCGPAALRLCSEAAAYALTRNIVIADTTFEFSLDEHGTLTMMNEVLAPDSSRFWPLAWGRNIHGMSPHLLLINPNTDEAVTRAMHDIAAEAAPAGLEIRAATAPFGAALITEEAALARAGDAVLALLSALDLKACAGVIISAFGDPGLVAARQRMAVPLTGIAEAGMAEAAQGGRRFSVVTTTPGLVAAITATARGYGHTAAFAGVRLTPGEPGRLMQQPEALLEALAQACEQAVQLDGAQAVVIGGGPLARAARALRERVAVPLIEPVPAAVRLALHRAKLAGVWGLANPR